MYTAQVLFFTNNVTEVNNMPSERNVPSVTDSRINTQDRVPRHEPVTPKSHAAILAIHPS